MKTIFEGKKIVGAVFEDDILGLMLKGREIKKMIVREVMGTALPVIAPQSISETKNRVKRFMSPPYEP